MVEPISTVADVIRELSAMPQDTPLGQFSDPVAFLLNVGNELGVADGSVRTAALVAGRTRRPYRLG